jgi:uncharacterized repeat protein (TIGR01451 family)
VPLTFTAPSGAPLGATDHFTVTDVSGSDSAARGTASFQIIGPLLADLAVEKRGAPGAAAVGRPLTYTVTAANAGPAAATGVVPTHTLPAGAALILQDLRSGLLVAVIAHRGPAAPRSVVCDCASIL